MGGFGLICVKTRVQAHLIHNFLQQAVNPKYPRNHYLYALYKWYMLEEQDGPKPLRPPFYTNQFFTNIKSINSNSQWNITGMTLSQWYQVLPQAGTTHTISTE